MRYIDKDLDSIQEMRNLLLNAQTAFVQLQQLTQTDLDSFSSSFINRLQNEMSQYIDRFVTVNEYGVREDEISLCQKFLQRFNETLQLESFVGIIDGDTDNKIIKIGVPLGAVVVLLPSHPSFTLLVNIILLAIKSGNSLVLVPNKVSKLSTIEAITTLISLAEECGYLDGAISMAQIISNQGIEELLESDKVSLLINIGCPEYISCEFRTNIPTIYGGESSGPVFIERSADIEQAVKDVIYSRSFDNGILPGAEQFLVTEKSIEEVIKSCMIANGAYLLNELETKQLIAFLKKFEKNIVNSYVGKSAKWLAKNAGFSVPEVTKVLVSIQDYMTEEDFFSQKLLCPIIIVYLEPDWTLACTKCMALLSELKMGHTLTIHSKNWHVIREFATVKSVGRMIVNAPTVCSATGLTTNLLPSLILGGITTGRGFSSENITPRHLTYTRCVGFNLEQ